MVTARTLLSDKGDAPKGERDEGRSHRPKKRQRLQRDEMMKSWGSNVPPRPAGQKSEAGKLVQSLRGVGQGAQRESFSIRPQPLTPSRGGGRKLSSLREARPRLGGGRGREAALPNHLELRQGALRIHIQWNREGKGLS